MNAKIFDRFFFFFISLTLVCFAKTDCIVIEAQKNMLDAEQSLFFSNNVKWELFLKNIRSKIMSFEHAVDAIHYTQDSALSGIGFDHRKSVPIDSLRAEAESLISEFPHFSQSITQICESPYSMFSTNLDGRAVTNILHYHYRYLLQSLTYVSKPSIVCEIGGGYGDVERLWLTNPIFNPDVCIVIDFPESLFFAEVFLKANFENDPSIDIVYLKNSMDVNSLQKGKKSVVLCPIGKEDLLHFPIDLVTNTGSLQEMTDPWVDYWMQWLDKADVKYFYSLNYGACPVTSVGAEVLGATTWSPRLSNKWSYLHNTTDPFLLIYSGFAEIVAVKDEKIPRKNELIATFNRCWSRRKNDAQGFVECLDVVRRLPEQEIIWELLRRIFEEMSFIPRETYFLLNMLLSNASVDFLVQHETEIERMKNLLSFTNG